MDVVWVVSSVRKCALGAFLIHTKRARVFLWGGEGVPEGEIAYQRFNPVEKLESYVISPVKV